MGKPSVPLEADPLWYKDAIIYEVHVRAFYDSRATAWAILPA